MKRKLILLNIVLLALIAAAGWRLRVEFAAAKAREHAVLKQALKPAPPPPYSALPAAKPVVPASYTEIAQKMLFAKDRNPDVVVETTPPPPPKPMPPMPVLYGIMNIGDGPTAIMAEKTGAQNRDVRPGDKFGEFKVLAVDTQEIVFEWDGKPVRRKVEELRDKSADKAPEIESRVAAVAAAPAPVVHVQATPEPSNVDMGKGMKACQAGDNSPAGTVANGMKKVVWDSPFGQGCRWEPVK